MNFEKQYTINITVNQVSLKSAVKAFYSFLQLTGQQTVTLLSKLLF